MLNSAHNTQSIKKIPMLVLLVLFNNPNLLIQYLAVCEPWVKTESEGNQIANY